MSIFNGIKKASIKKTVVMTVIIFSSAIALLVSVLSFGISAGYLRRSQRQSSYISLQLLGNEINTDLERITSCLDTIRFSAPVDNYLLRAKDFRGKMTPEFRQLSLDTWSSVNNSYNSNACHELIKRLIISTNDGSRYLQISKNPNESVPDFSKRIMSIEDFDYLSSSKVTSYKGLYNSPLTSSNDSLIVPVILNIYRPSSDEKTGFLYAEISTGFIEDHIPLMSLAPDSRLYFSFDGTGDYIYKDGSFEKTSLPAGLISYTLPGNKNISISLSPSKREFRLRLLPYLGITILVFFFIFILGIVLMLYLRRLINAPVDALLLKLKSTGSGDFERRADIEWNNEFGDIGRGINDLSENVKELIDSRLEDERERQELEYRMLQAQINPHFMYNTLNTIKWMASIQGADGIASISTSLSRLLKNISKGTESLISLRDELSLLEDYFAIMKYRYAGTIELDCKVDDPSLLDSRINRFSLQPPVENAIFHGIEPKGSRGSINVHVFREDDRLLIDIRDDGVGMDDETIKRVLMGEQDSKNDLFESVGIYNVNKRIKFSFGDEYGISIKSKVGEYTCVRITLPFDGGKE